MHRRTSTQRRLDMQRRLSAASLLLLITLSAHAEDGVQRLGEEIVPVFQEIRLEIDADSPTYSGSVRIELEARAPVRELYFHSEGPEFTRLELRTVGTTDGDGSDGGGSDGGILATDYAQVGEDLVRVGVGRPLAPGRYVLEIDFTNLFDVKATSLYRMEQGGKGYVFSQFETVDAREAFPCWDEPSFKIPFQVTLTTPRRHLALSNTPVESESVDGELRTTVFARSPPMPTYLLAIAAGPLEATPIPGLEVPARLITLEGRGALTGLAAEVTPPILAALEAWFDRPYPYAKLDILAVPEFWYGAMENPGLLAFSDGMLIIDPQTATVAQRRIQAKILAHELAHQWFGNLVTMAWWDDLWLNETFADWLADKIVHQLDPELALDLSNAQAAQGIMRGDAQATATAVRQPVADPATLLQEVRLAYAKGKTVLGMFEHWMGEETFRRGVLAYLDANLWGNATADDLWRALDAATDHGSENARASTTENGTTDTISTAMAGFLDQPGIPLIELAWLDDGKLELHQRRFHNAGSDLPALQWRIPVSLRWGTDDGARRTDVLLTAERQVVDLAAATRPQWIFPQADAMGYFRWSLPADELRRLASRASEILTPRERIALVGNLGAQLAAAELRADTYLEMLGALADDPEPLVLDAVLNDLDTVKTAFVTPELEAAFAAWIGKILRPALERFGREPRAGEAESVALVRSRLLDRLGDEGRDPEIRRWATRKTAALLGGEPDTVDPALVGLVLYLAALDGDEALFESYCERFEAAELPIERANFLNALGAFRSAALQKRALAYALREVVRPNEIFRITGAVRKGSNGPETVFSFTADHWPELTERLPPMYLAVLPVMARGCSAELLTQAEAFFAEPAHQRPGTLQRLGQVREQVGDCLNLRQREGASAAAFFQSMSGNALAVK